MCGRKERRVARLPPNGAGVRGICRVCDYYTSARASVRLARGRSKRAVCDRGWTILWLQGCRREVGVAYSGAPLRRCGGGCRAARSRPSTKPWVAGKQNSLGPPTACRMGWRKARRLQIRAARAPGPQRLENVPLGPPTPRERASRPRCLSADFSHSSRRVEKSSRLLETTGRFYCA